MYGSFNKVDITVNGEQIVLDLEEELQIKDLSSDIANVAAKMAIWGNILAAAEAEQESVDSHYRHWRATLGNKLLAANDKASEWKVKQEIEAAPEFLKFKEAIAKALQHATLASKTYDAFKTFSFALQNAGENARTEMSSGMAIRTEPAPKRERDVSASVSAMRDLNRKKRTSNPE